MNKVLFVNAINPNRLNYDLDDNSSWKHNPRLSNLKHKNGNKVPVCLHGLNTKQLPSELLLSLGHLQDWASLYTTGFQMKEGFYPLFLDGNTLYFTDVEECSFLDQNWALDNVYKTQLQGIPQFEPYKPESIEAKGWQQGIIVAQNIFVGDLFGVVSNTLPLIMEFSSSNRHSNVEITYSDRYVKTELALIISLQFIKDLVAALQPSNCKVKMIGSSFYEINANDDVHRRLADSFISDTNRDETGKTLINDNNYEFLSKPKEDIPHYRELLVKASKGGITHTLRIMPDAGLAHWGLDIQKCKAIRRYFSTNNGVDSEIPICSSTEQVYYVTQNV